MLSDEQYKTLMKSHEILSNFFLYVLKALKSVEIFLEDPEICWWDSLTKKKTKQKLNDLKMQKWKF